MKTRGWMLAIVGILLPLARPAGAADPSFDCEKASGQVEELICKDDALAALDRELSAVWAEAQTRLPESDLATEKARQRGWIKGRNECWKSDDVPRCVKSEYQTRIVELQIRSGQRMAPKPASYACEGENRPLTAAFYSDGEPRAVVLTLGDDQAIAFVAPSGSGARYTTQGVEFWEHQGEVKLDWFGTELECKVRK